MQYVIYDKITGEYLISWIKDDLKWSEFYFDITPNSIFSNPSEAEVIKLQLEELFLKTSGPIDFVIEEKNFSFV
jgi:hypothetical protein